MLGQLEGLTEEETKQKIMAFTPYAVILRLEMMCPLTFLAFRQQRDLLKAYYEHKHKQHADTTAANAKLTPEQQQEMLKDLSVAVEKCSWVCVFNARFNIQVQAARRQIVWRARGY